jgi:hypothetical protein
LYAIILIPLAFVTTAVCKVGNLGWYLITWNNIRGEDHRGLVIKHKRAAARIFVVLREEV